MTGKRVWRSVIAGAVGGLAASFVMNEFQALWAKAAGSRKPDGGGEPATVKLANAISRQVFDHPLSRAEKKWAGPSVHYAMGTLTGAAYGILADAVPVASAGCGTLYGSTVWLIADEIAVPAAGLSKPPSETPASSHVQALASHIVYGLAMDLGRRAILKVR